MTLQAGAVLVFGTGLAQQDYGIVQESSIREEVSRLENKAVDGSIVAIQDYGKVEKIKIVYVPLLTPTATPAIGTKFTFAGKSWSLLTIESIRIVDGFKSVTITGKYYEKIGASS